MQADHAKGVEIVIAEKTCKQESLPRRQSQVRRADSMSRTWRDLRRANTDVSGPRCKPPHDGQQASRRSLRRSHNGTGLSAVAQNHSRHDGHLCNSENLYAILTYRSPEHRPGQPVTLRLREPGIAKGIVTPNVPNLDHVPNFYSVPVPESGTVCGLPPPSS